MTDIYINFEKIHRASSYLSSKSYLFFSIRRTVGLSRWKLPDKVKKQKNVENRIEEIMRQLQIAEQLMNEMKTVTNSCISQYMNAENVNTDNANKFI